MSKVYVLTASGMQPVNRRIVVDTRKQAADQALKIGPFARNEDRAAVVQFLEGAAPHDSAYFFVKEPAPCERYPNAYSHTHIVITPAEKL